MPTSHIQTLRAMLREEKGVILPGAPNALAARIIADLGFRAVYLTGAGLTNMHLGLPDLGFMDLSQVADHVMAIRCVIDLPLIVDIDTGFGNAVNVTHTVRILEQAGASAIQNRGPSVRPNGAVTLTARSLIPLEEMVWARYAPQWTPDGRIWLSSHAPMHVPSKASRRQSSGPVATSRRARTSHSSRAPESLEDHSEAVPPSPEGALSWSTWCLGARHPIVDKKAVAEMGFSLVLYANAALQGAVHGMQVDAVDAFKEKGILNERAVTSFAERQRLVDKQAFDLMWGPLRGGMRLLARMDKPRT